MSERVWKPGDRALIRFGEAWRAAEMTPGFIWATPDGEHRLFAEGGFEARPLMALVHPHEPESEPEGELG